MWNFLKKLNPFKFGYDATTTTTRRRAPKSDTKSEDDHLDATQRRKLISTTRDLRRNFTLAAWMIRQHVNFVATHTFQSKNDNKALDDQIEKLVKWWSLKQNFDFSRKHSFHRFMRLAEIGRVLDGDMFIWKSKRGSIAGIEGDRIANPTSGGKLSPEVMKQYKRGVRTNKNGEHVSYILNNRVHDGGRLEYSKVLDARDVIQFAYFDRFDQIRGISPLAAGINPLQDSAEAVVYALARAKVSQLFALAFKRGNPEASGEISGGTGEDGVTVDKSKFAVDFGKGPIVLELEPEDEATFMESKQPSTELQTFLDFVIMLAMKALDIPYSFFREDFTNYSGARQALILYLLSVKEKQQDVQELLNSLTYWRLTLWIANGIITLPPGMTISDLQWEWHSVGVPWIDPTKEVIGDTKAVELGVNTRTRIVKRTSGADWLTDILPELKKEHEEMIKIYGDPNAEVENSKPKNNESSNDKK